MSDLKDTIYGLTDLLTFNKGIPRKINNYTVRFPAKWARYFETDYEHENVAFLTKTCKKGMTVVDIGAHLGLMSVIIAKLVGEKGKVYSFEPTPKTFEIFKRIITLNHFDTIIKPYNKAVSNFVGMVDFFVDENEGSNANSLVSRKDKNRASQKTEVNTLDNIISEIKTDKLNLIKIDAEGSELDVLLGAKNTIYNYRPIIILAIHPSLVKNNDQKLEDIYDLLITYKYSIFYRSEILTKDVFCNKADFFDVHLIPE
jgi:FkbM family methyltransferase